MGFNLRLSPADRRLLLLLGILSLAAFLRLGWLGDVDLRGDEVTYFLDLEDGIEVFDYLSRHFETFGSDRQMPLPRVLGAAVVQGFGLEVDEFSVRLPFALAGIATIPMFWMLGWFLGGLRNDEDAEPLAATLAFLVAINPYHVYWSRTAHIYVFPMLFLGVALACTAGWTKRLVDGREMDRGGRWFLAGIVAGSTLAGYAHMSAWIGAGVLWYVVLGLWLWRHNPPFRWPVRPWPRAVVVAFGVWLLLLLPWAVKFVIGLATQNYDPVWDEVTNPLNRFVAMWRIPFIMTWGGEWRSLLTLGLPIAAIVLAWRRPGWRRPIWVVLTSVVVLFGALSLAQITGFFAVRYYIPLWPVLILLSGIGVLLLARRLERPVLVPVVVGLIGLAMAMPLRDLLLLRGNPVEYRRLADALDDNFASETPALVNGMNVVLFEIRPYAPKQVMPTFTVEDIGFGMWKDNDWRGSAESFLQDFPDAVLVQQGRNFYDPELAGPWDFPESYFAESIELRNEPALRLRRRLLAGSTDFYSGAVEDNRAITRIHFNRREDLVDRARAEGRDALIYFDEDWSYFKPDPSSDWRVLRKNATLKLHNLTETTQDIQVALYGIVPEGRKRVQVLVHEEGRVDEGTGDEGTGGEEAVEGAPVTLIAQETLQSFEQPFTWRFSVTVEPGSTRLELLDELYDFGLTPLFAARVTAESPAELEASAATQTTADDES
ncbi:MAG: hypothetical protein AAGD38_05440 [Acidobacteriota bacterium]